MICQRQGCSHSAHFNEETQRYDIFCWRCIDEAEGRYVDRKEWEEAHIDKEI